MDSPTLGGAEFVGLGFGPRRSRWHAALLRCLHFVTCRICDPPPEVPDSARLVLATATFSASAALLVVVLRSWVLSLAYCALGLARLLPARGSSILAIVAFSILAWLLLFCCPASMDVWIPAILVAVSELCWLGTLQKVLDEEFEAFVSILFIFLGVELTFGFYPLLMHWGPLVLSSKQVHEAVHVVVVHAVQGGQQGGVSPVQPSQGGGPGALHEPEHVGPLIVFSQVLPLVALVVGVPAVSLLVLMYWWMFEHMSRMVQAVSLTFISWMALYGLLSMLHVPVSRDTIGKAILGSVCVVMYHAFSRLTCIDWHAARVRLVCVAVVFIVVFMLDQLIPSASHLCPPLLFSVMVICKVAYSTGANFLEEGEGGMLRPKHLLPLRTARMSTAERGSAGSPTEAAGGGADVPLTPNYV
mmetsp:Transcript_9494/g.29427  ORF Transcript_9494/g.29427 Transcript_9494/m.29427 type:complete len:415 (+) Transcript_9494:92-1336(+)